MSEQKYETMAEALMAHGLTEDDFTKLLQIEVLTKIGLICSVDDLDDDMRDVIQRVYNAAKPGMSARTRELAVQFGFDTVGEKAVQEASK